MCLSAILVPIATGEVPSIAWSKIFSAKAAFIAA
jgi:hypothetical protein